MGNFHHHFTWRPICVLVCISSITHLIFIRAKNASHKSFIGKWNIHFIFNTVFPGIWDKWTNQILFYCNIQESLWFSSHTQNLDYPHFPTTDASPPPVWIIWCTLYLNKPSQNNGTRYWSIIHSHTILYTWQPQLNIYHCLWMSSTSIFSNDITDAPWNLLEHWVSTRISMKFLSILYKMGKCALCGVHVCDLTGLSVPNHWTLFFFKFSLRYFSRTCQEPPVLIQIGQK